METLRAIYIALAVFGAGVTIVDLFGAFEQGGGHADHDGHDGQEAQGGHDAHDGHDGHHAHEPQGGSLLAGNEDRTRTVARLIALMRTGVYFSLGAGCTGLVALGTGQGALGSLAWGAAAGVGIAALARFLRRSLRRDLDSSFSPEEFLLEEAQVIVPIGPGMMGKVEVRKYGAATEVYARAEDPAQAFVRGARVRLIDYREGSYLVEPADEEHLVH